MNIIFCWRDSCFNKNFSNKISSAYNLWTYIIDLDKHNYGESSGLRLLYSFLPAQRDKKS